MHALIRPRQQFRLAGLVLLLVALAGYLNLHNAAAVATKKVNLGVTLDIPQFVTSPVDLILCPDTTTNLGPDTSTFTSVKFYLGTNTNNPASNLKLVAYGTGSNARNVPGFSPGSNFVRSNSTALFHIPNPRPTGRQYVIAEIVVGAGDQEMNYKNNVAVAPLDF